MDAYQRKVLRELIRKPHVPQKVKRLHGDIEDAIAERGGERGSYKPA